MLAPEGVHEVLRVLRGGEELGFSSLRADEGMCKHEYNRIAGGSNGVRQCTERTFILQRVSVVCKSLSGP